jgi:hypothetical protein
VQAIRGIRIDRPSGPSPVKVALSSNADPSFARKAISQALALLENPGKMPVCGIDGSHHSMSHKQAMADFQNSLGPYQYEQAAGTFILSRGSLRITFWLPVGEDGAPRIDCWSREDVVVTS